MKNKKLSLIFISWFSLQSAKAQQVYVTEIVNVSGEWKAFLTRDGHELQESHRENLWRIPDLAPRHCFQPKSINIFSSPKPKAELLWSLFIPRSAIVHPSVRCPSSVRHPLVHNFEQLLLWNAWVIFFKFLLEPSVNGALKICTNGLGPLIKMATMPIYGKKHLKIFFFRTKKASRLNIGI